MKQHVKSNFSMMCVPEVICLMISVTSVRLLGYFGAAPIHPAGVACVFLLLVVVVDMPVYWCIQSHR